MCFGPEQDDFSLFFFCFDLTNVTCRQQGHSLPIQRQTISIPFPPLPPLFVCCCPGAGAAHASNRAARPRRRRRFRPRRAGCDSFFREGTRADDLSRAVVLSFWSHMTLTLTRPSTHSGGQRPVSCDLTSPCVSRGSLLMSACCYPPGCLRVPIRLHIHHGGTKARILSDTKSAFTWPWPR